MNQIKKCSHTGFWVTIGILSLFILISFTMNFGLLIGLAGSGEKAIRSGEEAEDEFPRYTERWSFGDGDAKVVRISVEGVIFRERKEGFFGKPYDKVESLLRQIRAARQDEDVRGIILEVSSPGGGLTSSDEIYHALKRFKESREDRKIVAFTRDMSASGGYYLSMPADWIIAEPTAIIGSIGVIMQTLNWQGLSERIGITDTTIKSGENKDILNPFHEVPPEQIELLQSIVDTFYDRFFDIVQTARGVSKEKLKSLADGRVVTAEDALENNLIDQIGYWEDAVSKTAELLGEESIRVVRYEHRPTFFEMFSIHSPISLPSLSVPEAPRFMYLWKP